MNSCKRRVEIFRMLLLLQIPRIAVPPPARTESEPTGWRVARAEAAVTRAQSGPSRGRTARSASSSSRATPATPRPPPSRGSGAWRTWLSRTAPGGRGPTHTLPWPVSTPASQLTALPPSPQPSPPSLPRRHPPHHKSRNPRPGLDRACDLFYLW